LTAEQRSLVELRLSRLSDCLLPAPPAEIGKWCCVLQSALNAANLDPVMAAANAEAYLIALDGAPAFALEEAAKRVLRGKAGLSRAFVPTAPELRGLVDEISLPARWYALRLRRLLDAEVEREPERPSVDRASQIAAAAIAALPAVTRRRPGNPAGVNHADKGGW
jgi:hypothetical protein